MTTTAIHPVAAANVGQARAWDGDEGAYWARHADAYEASLRNYQAAFLGAAALTSTDRVLDVGCGTGDTTRAAARVVADGRAVGVDLSRAMLDVARGRASAAGLSNIEFVQGDASVLAFEPASFDVVVSRTGAMFFGNPDIAFRALAEATRPGGRLVLLVWQSMDVNEWFFEFVTSLAAGRSLPTPPPHAPGPFALSDPTWLRALLEGNGWADVTIEGHAEPMYFGPTVEEAHDLIAGQLGWLLEDLDPGRRDSALRALHSSMERHLSSEGVTYRSAAWIVVANRS